MKISFYSIYDSRAAAYLPPITARNDGTAVRMFHSAVQDPSTDFAKWSDDYALFHLGDFDDETGKIEPNNSPRVLITGTQIAALIKREN